MKKPSPELLAAAESCLADLMARHPLPYAPRIEWRNYRVTAGMAYYRIGVIGLSYHVLTTPGMVVDTLTHEYAHLLAVARHGVRAAGHGPAWRQAMRDLGQEPKVRHNYEVVRNERRQRVTYRCLKCGKQFDRPRRLPQHRKYVHASCGGDLRLVSVTRVTGDA